MDLRLNRHRDNFLSVQAKLKETQEGTPQWIALTTKSQNICKEIARVEEMMQQQQQQQPGGSGGQGFTVVGTGSPTGTGGISWKPPASSTAAAPAHTMMPPAPAAPPVKKDEPFVFLKHFVPDDDDDDVVVAMPGVLSPVLSSPLASTGGGGGSIWGNTTASNTTTTAGDDGAGSLFFPSSSSFLANKSHDPSPLQTPVMENNTGGGGAAFPIRGGANNYSASSLPRSTSGNSVSSSSIPKPAPVASTSVMDMIARAPRVAASSGGGSAGSPTTDSTVGSAVTSGQSYSIAPQQDEWQLLSSTTAAPVAQSKYKDPSARGAEAVKGGSLEQLRLLRAGLAASGPCAPVGIDSSPPTSGPDMMMGSLPPMEALAPAAPMTYSSIAARNANKEASAATPAATVTPAASNNPRVTTTSAAVDSKKSTNKAFSPTASPTTPHASSSGGGAKDFGNLSNVRVVVELEPTPTSEIPDSTIHSRFLLKNTRHSNSNSAADVAYFAFPDKEELKELEESSEFKPKMEKHKMERVFLGQLPYTTSEALVQWIAYYFGNGARLFYVEKITKNAKGGGVNTANPSKPGEYPTGQKLPTGCFHGYVEKQDANNLLVGLHKKLLIDNKGLWCALFSGSVDETMHPTYPAQISQADSNKRDKQGLQMLASLRSHCLDLKKDPSKRAPMMPYGLAVCQLATSNYDPESYSKRPNQDNAGGGSGGGGNAGSYRGRGGGQNNSAAAGRGGGSVAGVRKAPHPGNASYGRGGGNNASLAVSQPSSKQDVRPSGTSWAQTAKGSSSGSNNNASGRGGAGAPACVDF